ncbi:MAG: Crp/Fnr family transcriptional regulator [Saprospiraceae bacterium]
MNSAHTSSEEKSPQQQDPAFEILRYISQFMHLSEAEAKVLIENMNFKAFKKGDILLKEGQVSNLCYFTLKGCVRQYYLVDGEEKTINFFTEGQPIAPNEGPFKSMPSKCYLACLEDSILSVGTPEDQVKLFEKYPQFEAAARIAIDAELGKSQDNFAAFMIRSPEERYLNLMKTRPELLDRVPQYQLASYLGIKPESLSRIRKRIMLK